MIGRRSLIRVVVRRPVDAHAMICSDDVRASRLLLSVRGVSLTLYCTVRTGPTDRIPFSGELEEDKYSTVLYSYSLQVRGIHTVLVTRTVLHSVQGHHTSTVLQAQRSGKFPIWPHHQEKDTRVARYCTVTRPRPCGPACAKTTVRRVCYLL